MDCVRVGTIGLGGIAQGVHLPGTKRCEKLHLAAICDLNAQKLKTIGEQYGVPENRRFLDYHDLIACDDVEAVDICTPNDVHYPMAMEAVRAGKNFACEKPMCMNAGEAAALAAAAREAGVKSMVCFSYRFKAAARYARDLIAQGVLGDIYHVDAQYYQSWGLPCFDTPRVWRFIKERTGTGALGDLGSHALDLARFVLKQDYSRVLTHAGTFVDHRKACSENPEGPVDVDDFCNVLAETQNGAAATFRITRFGYGRGNYQYMEIYGTKGALVYKLDERGDNVDTLSACIEPLGRENHVFVDLPIPEKYRVDQMRCFAELLLGRPDGLTADVEDGLSNMRVVDAVVHSAQSGQWVNV